MSLGRNDAVQRIMKFADFGTFLKMRLVCKKWHSWSHDSIQHWYNWLCDWGPRDKFILQDHNWINCELGEPKCRIHHHYNIVKHPPKLLKTMPYCDQVFRLGAQRQIAHLTKLYDNYYCRIGELGRQLEVAKRNYKDIAIRKQQSETAANELMDRLETRKRRRISKPQ